MDFELKIGDEVKVFEGFSEALECIRGAMATWNNFYEGETLEITLNKIPGQTPTLSVSVGDTAKTGDVFGGLPEGVSEEEYLARGTITVEQMDMISAKIKEILDAKGLKGKGQ